MKVIYGVLLFLAAAASFNGFYTKIQFLDGNAYRGFESIVDGTANRPYIYRQLIPAIANWADRSTPQTLRQRLTSAHSDDGRSFYEALFQSPVALNPVNSFRYLVMYIEVFVAAVVAVFALYFVCRAEGYEPKVAVIASSVLILLVPYVQIRGGGFYSDYPELAFLSLAVLVSRQFHWLWLIPIAALGTYNKESFILILLTLWPILKWRWGRLFASLQIAGLEILAIAIYWISRVRFSGNPGGTVENHLQGQLSFFLHPVNWIFKLGKVYGIFLPEMMSLIPVAIVVWLTWRGWKEISSVMRQHAIVAASIIFPLFIVLSTPGETRDFSMLYIVLLLVIGANPHCLRIIRRPLRESSSIARNLTIGPMRYMLSHLCHRIPLLPFRHVPL